MKRCLMVLGASILAVLAGCASVGLLGEEDFRGAGLASRMQRPPEATISADYSARIDREDPVGSVVRFGTSLAKAAEVRRAEERLERALEAVDVPEEIRRAALEECADVLGCNTVERSASADYLLELEIREYGIDANNWSAAPELRIDLMAVLRDNRDGRAIWRARVREGERMSPEIFGLGGAMGNIVSAVTLSELSVQEIAAGLAQLAGRAARRAADRLERDLWRARRI